MDRLEAAQRPELSTFDSSATVVDNNITHIDDFIDLEAQQPQSQHPIIKTKKVDDFDENDHEYDDNSDSESIITIGNNEEHDSKDKEDPKNEMFLDNVDDFPEGGLRAYLVVFGSFMGLIPVFGLFNILGVIESYVNEHQLSTVESSVVGWIFSIFSFITYTTCIFSGTYFDRNGARVPLIAGTICVCSGLVATASSRTVIQFILSFSLLTGLGNGLLLSPLIAVVSHYFLQKRAMFSSVSTLGGSLGGVVFPNLLKVLFPALGFEWGMRIFALICFVCLVISIILARERFNNSEKYANETFKQRSMAYLSSFDAKSLKDLKFLFCTLGALFAEVSAVSLITYFASYSLQRGFSSNTSYTLVTIVNAGTIPGRLITGFLADKLGRYNVIITSVFLSGACGLVLWMPFGYNVGVLYAYAALYGFFSGSIFSLLPVCCGQICKTEDFGKRYSTMYFTVAFGTLVGVPIGGAIIGDKTIQNYNYFIIYTAIVTTLSSICYIISRYFAVGRKILAKF